MTAPNRVVWSQGMFLRPHHFQQQERHFTYELQTRVQAAHPNAWGFGELTLDESVLSTGRVGLLRASGSLPDGTTFAIGSFDAVPPAFDVPHDMRDEWVCLTAPAARVGATEVDWRRPGDGADAAARWTVQTVPLRDATMATDDPEEVQTGTLNLRLVRARDLANGQPSLPIARVRERREQTVVLDATYVPPQYRIDASAQLNVSAGLIHNLIRQQSRSVAESMGQVTHGVSELAEFLKLMALNRAEPPWRQIVASPTAHPAELHVAMLALVGELYTFEAPERRPPEYPAYRHDDLQAVFAPLLADLRRLLSAVPERRAIAIELQDLGRGLYTGQVAELGLLDTARFVLAAQCQVPAEQLRQRLPKQCKVAPRDRIRDLVRLSLPGIGLHAVTAAPRQLPLHAGHQYFELDQNDELWSALKPTGALALHVAGEFPGLELALWAIRA